MYFTVVATPKVYLDATPMAKLYSTVATAKILFLMFVLQQYYILTHYRLALPFGNRKKYFRGSF